jgi:hypothetical protein
MDNPYALYEKPTLRPTLSNPSPNGDYAVYDPSGTASALPTKPTGIENPYSKYEKPTENPYAQFSKPSGDKAETVLEGFIKPTAKSIIPVTAHTAASLMQMPVSGLVAGAKLISSGGDLNAANKVLEENQQVLDDYYLTTTERKKAAQNIGVIGKPIEMAGQGLQEIVKLTPLEGTIAEPIANTVGQASAIFGTGGAKNAAYKRSGLKNLEGVIPEAKASTAPIIKVEPAATSQGILQKEPSANRPTLESVVPQVQGGRVGKLSKYADESSINLEKLNTTDDVKQFVNGMTGRLEETIGKRKVSWDEIRATAEQLGWDVKDIKKAWDKKGSFTAAEMDATRQTNLNTITKVHEKIRQLPADKSQWTPEIRAEFLDMMDLIKVTSQASSEAGRALNIHRRVLSNDPAFTEASQINNVLKKLKGSGVDKTDALIDALREIDFNNPADVNQFVYNATKTKWQKLSDGAFSLWINGLLSHPLTHIVNTTSNALTLAYTYTERVVATSLEAVRAKATGTPREIYAGELKQDIFSFSKGLQDASKRFVDAMKRGEQSNKFDYKYSGLPNKVERFLPTRALMAEDAFFKGFIENQEMNRIAHNTARKEGLKGTALKNRITELLETPSPEMLEKASSRGKYLTYQKELGHIGNMVLNARNTIPGLKYFTPFVKTPTNIAKFALERSPLGFANVVSKAAKGELKGVALSEELAKPLLGSMLGFTIYQMAELGYITGGQSKNKAAREEKANVGWQPYSFKIGDTYYGYNRLEPLGSIVGMAADLSQIKNEAQENDKFNLAASVSGSISQNISNKTFMQGFSNMINAISDPVRYGDQLIKGTAGSIVPSVAAGVARSKDDKMRDTSSVTNAIKARIPGVSETIPAKLNVWGEPIERPGTAVSRFVSPVSISQEKGSKLEKELVKLKLDIGMPSKSISGVKLQPEEYWQLVKQSGGITKRVLDSVVNSSKWDSIPDITKEKIIKSTVDKIRNQARQQLIMQLLKNGRITINRQTGKIEEKK